MPFRTASILRAVAAVLLFAALLGDADAQERAAPRWPVSATAKARSTK